MNKKMATKTFDFNPTKLISAPKIPIELINCIEINKTNSLLSEACPTEGWQNIALIVHKYDKSGLDLMYVWDEDYNCGLLYLGHWNDGVV